VPEGRCPSAIQLYFLDGGGGVEQQRLLLIGVRTDRGQRPTRAVRFLLSLIETLLQEHPYRRELLPLRERLLLPGANGGIVAQDQFRLHGANAGTYERATADDVMGIIDDSAGGNNAPPVAIFLRGRQRQEGQSQAPSSVRSLSALHAAHNPLAYVLLYFNRVLPGGWHPGLRYDAVAQGLTPCEQHDLERARAAVPAPPQTPTIQRGHMTQREATFTLLMARELPSEAYRRAAWAARCVVQMPPLRRVGC